MSDIDDILAQLDKAGANAVNEAETRLKIIDQILFKILGWGHDDVSVEERVSEDKKTTWADYIIRTGNTSLILEAKKIGVIFENVPNSRRAQLRGAIMEGPTGEAIRQARNYARKKSIPFAIVSNGKSWLVFPASRVDSVEFEKSSVIIFDDISDILKNNLGEFHALLSRDSVVSGSLEQELLGRAENQLLDRKLNRFFTKSFSKITRHSIFPLIENEIETAFSEDMVNKNPELLSGCYVQTPDRTRFDSRIRMHIQKRDIAIPGSERPVREGASNPLIKTIKTAGQRVRPAALLILGSVGSGKTTFLYHTRHVTAANLFDTNTAAAYPHWIHVDFKELSPDTNPTDFLFAAMKAYIDKDLFLSDYDRCIKYAYKEDIEALLRGPMSLLANDESEKKRRISDMMLKDFQEVRPYVDKILGYAASNTPIFLVVDNVDQFTDQKIQENIFSAAIAIAHKLHLNLIVSLREETYVANKSLPVFDAFDVEAIHIDAPQISAVLSRRFFLTRMLLDGKSGYFTAENGAPVKVENYSTIIDLIQSSVLGTEIGNRIEVLAARDVRLALRMTREFLKSGWTASGKAYGIYSRTGKYTMPPHEAMRAIMLGSQSVYSEQLSVLGNIFDSKLGRNESQLLRLYVLSSLVRLSSDKSFAGISGEEILRNLNKIGFSSEHGLAVLKDLCQLRFAFTTSHSRATMHATYIPSQLGGYIVRDLAQIFVYLENVLMDTFIADKDTWDKLYELTDKVYNERNILKKLEYRKQRVRLFYDYIKQLYSPLAEESQRRGLSFEWCGHPLVDGENSFSSNLEKITSSAQRNYGANADDYSRAKAQRDKGNKR